MEEAGRGTRARRWAQALSALATVSMVGGAVLVLLWARPVATTVMPEAGEPTTAEVPPSTVPPLVTTTTSSTTTTTTTTPPPTPTHATLPATTTSNAPTTTGLADLLPPIHRGGAIVDERTERAMPASIETSAFDTTSFPIRPIGIEDDGQLEIPDETEIGWYRYGSTSGEPGATVLAAHVSWNDAVGPFFELGTMEPGDEVLVTLDDGTERLYEVVERNRYDKQELPRERIWRTTGDETLVLITCGGDFNPDIRSFQHNVVVYAVPVG